MKVRGLVLLFLLVSPAVLHSQDTLPPVVVSSTRLRDVEQPALQVPGKVIVVTGEEIEKLGARTIQEVLEYQTGIVAFDAVGSEFQKTIDLRGFNGQPVSATSVFVDGVRINEPDFNTINFDLIPIEAIDRIEILLGTATVFGRNALGGVINITTKRGRSDRAHFGFDIGGGSFGRQKYSFNSDGPLPLANFDYYFGVTRELTNGFREEFNSRHAGAGITRLLAKLGYRLGENTDASLAYTRVLDNISQAGSLPASRLRIDRNDNLTPGDHSASNLHQVALNLKQKLTAGFSAALNGFFRSNDVELFTRGLSSESTLKTDTTSGGTTLQASHEGAILERKNLLTLGFEYSRNSFQTVNMGVFLPAFTFQNRQSTKEDVFGVYLSDSFHLFDSTVLNAGLRYDWDRFNFTDKIDPTLSGQKSYHRVSPKAGLVYSPMKTLSLSFSYSEGVRIPTVDEIFAQGPFGSNLALTTMKSRNFELGAKGHMQDWLDASLALFYTPVRDEILFVVTDPINFFGRNENIARTLRRGIELSIKARYQKWLDGFINYTLTKATFETDVLLFSGQVRKGNELPLVPRHRIGLGVNAYPIDGLTLSLFGNYVGEQFMVGDEPNHTNKVANYFVLNSRIAYQWKQITGYVKLNNLTDRKYSTSGILVNEPFRVPAPGFNVFAGLSFRY
ncbi:MAG: putative TonB-dependent siderophore receptor [Deltaproteobacteria bacterium]|nr:putative TonB-dependent siderophore receptor [Deltaproteobacteria bacterium]